MYYNVHVDINNLHHSRLLAIINALKCVTLAAHVLLN